MSATGVYGAAAGDMVVTCGSWYTSQLMCLRAVVLRLGKHHVLLEQPLQLPAPTAAAAAAGIHCSCVACSLISFWFVCNCWIAVVCAAVAAAAAAAARRPRRPTCMPALFTRMSSEPKCLAA
jgi:hypothetical protein